MEYKALSKEFKDSAQHEDGRMRKALEDLSDKYNAMGEGLHTNGKTMKNYRTFSEDGQEPGAEYVGLPPQKRDKFQPHKDKPQNPRYQRPFDKQHDSRFEYERQKNAEIRAENKRLKAELQTKNDPYKMLERAENYHVARRNKDLKKGLLLMMAAGLGGLAGYGLKDYKAGKEQEAALNAEKQRSAAAVDEAKRKGEAYAREQYTKGKKDGQVEGLHAKPGLHYTFPFTLHYFSNFQDPECRRIAIQEAVSSQRMFNYAAQQAPSYAPQSQYPVQPGQGAPAAPYGHPGTAQPPQQQADPLDAEISALKQKNAALKDKLQQVSSQNGMAALKQLQTNPDTKDTMQNFQAAIGNGVRGVAGSLWTLGKDAIGSMMGGKEATANMSAFSEESKAAIIKYFAVNQAADVKRQKLETRDALRKENEKLEQAIDDKENSFGNTFYQIAQISPQLASQGVKSVGAGLNNLVMGAIGGVSDKYKEMTNHDLVNPESMVLNDGKQHLTAEEQLAEYQRQEREKEAKATLDYISACRNQGVDPNQQLSADCAKYGVSLEAPDKYQQIAAKKGQQA